MDVTRKNFKELLPKIESSILEASFIAIDGEFSGLSLPGKVLNGFDLPEDRYEKLRESVSELLLMQFGMCTFAWNEETEKYVEHAFNFYVFPKPFNRQAVDRRFTCQSSSIDFLASQGFDFNKVFKEGIPYMLPAEEEKLRAMIDEKFQQKQDLRFSPAFASPAPDGSNSSINKGPPVIPDEHKDLIDSVCDKISDFLSGEEAELPLAAFNGYLRKLIYQITEIKFPEGIMIETRINENKLRYQVVVRVKNADEVKQREEEKRLKEQADLADAVGFTHVVKMLSRSGKTIVGHNMLMDLLYTISQFLCPLPKEYEEFKMLVQSSFPRLIDTKLVASQEPFLDLIPITVLGELHTRMQQEPFLAHTPVIEFAEGFPDYNTNKEKLHEAGYDAHITGVSYATMLKFANGKLDRFLNKLNIMRLYDIPYMNLNGKDVSPNRDHVFHVTFPVLWKYQDILQLFSPFGPVSISWINETSAFVSLNRKEAAPSVPRQLKNTDLYQVITFKDYRTRMDFKRKSHYVGTPKGTPVQSNYSTPVNHMAGHKRKLPISDVELDVPEKRKARDSGEFREKRKSFITPIPEESEDSKSQSCATAGEDLGMPVKRAADKASFPVPDVSPKDKNEFDVPSNW